MRSDGFDSRPNIDSPDVLELPDGDVQGGKSSGPADSGRAVNYDRRSGIVLQLFRTEVLESHLGLLLSDPLQEV